MKIENWKIAGFFKEGKEFRLDIVDAETLIPSTD